MNLLKITTILLSLFLFNSFQTHAQEEVNLLKFGIAEDDYNQLGGLEVGTMAPDFTTQDLQGNIISLSELYQKGPVVLVFYRGYWCPVCTRHLSEFERELAALKFNNVNVLAISPETAEFAEKTVEKTDLSIPVISDSDKSIMEKYQVAFKVTEKYDKKIKTLLRKDIAEANGDDAAFLPIPATYLIDTNGKIKYVHYDPNYKKRASVQDILDQLDN